MLPFLKDKVSRNAPLALLASGDYISRQQFLEDIGALTAHLSLQPQARWALCFTSSYWFTVSLYALALAGKEIVLPGNIQSAKALAGITQYFDAIIGDQEINAGCRFLRPAPGQGRTALPERFIADSSLTLFTSGTTGVATAIPKTFRQLNREVLTLARLFRSHLRDCVVLGTVSHQHIYGLLFRILLPLSLGVPFADFLLEYPDQVARHAACNRVLVSSPALLKRLTIETVAEGYAKVFSSGGFLPFIAAQQSLQLFGSLPIEVYGSSETGGIAWRQQTVPDEPWTPFPGIDIRCTEEGCLEICSPFLAQTDWHSTHDMVTLHPDGRFDLRGRADRIVKLSEKRVSLVEIEQRLLAFPEILDVVVVLLEREPRFELGAVVVLSEKGLEDLDQQGRFAFWSSIKIRLRQHIDAVGLPRRFRVVQQIPVNSQGKSLINTLVELFT